MSPTCSYRTSGSNLRKRQQAQGHSNCPSWPTRLPRPESVWTWIRRWCLSSILTQGYRPGHSALDAPGGVGNDAGSSTECSTLISPRSLARSIYLILKTVPKRVAGHRMVAASGAKPYYGCFLHVRDAPCSHCLQDAAPGRENDLRECGQVAEHADGAEAGGVIGRVPMALGRAR